jgi:DNA mismatch endonuclease, patch repair protein
MADNLTKQQRSYCMSRVKVRGTNLELPIRSQLVKHGLKFRINVPTLPGKPDIVFPVEKLAIFLDGDFWHGYRFPKWRATVSNFWQEKIGKNRNRDRRNFARLRKMGWRVLRIWQHQIKRDPTLCVEKIVFEYNSRVKLRRSEKARKLRRV